MTQSVALSERMVQKDFDERFTDEKFALESMLRNLREVHSVEPYDVGLFVDELSYRKNPDRILSTLRETFTNPMYHGTWTFYGKSTNPTTSEFALHLFDFQSYVEGVMMDSEGFAFVRGECQTDGIPTRQREYPHDGLREHFKQLRFRKKYLEVSWHSLNREPLDYAIINRGEEFKGTFELFALGLKGNVFMHLADTKNEEQRKKFQIMYDTNIKRVINRGCPGKFDLRGRLTSI